jgi:hypothetical protein
MRVYFERHLTSVALWIFSQNQIRAYESTFAALVRIPDGAASPVADFLDTPLDIKSMARIVDPPFPRRRVA